MAQLPSRLERIAKLVSLPSVSCMDPAFDRSNRAVIEQLADWLEPLGFEVELLSLADDKLNLVASLGKGDGGLALAGHTDTVPADDNLWSSSPYALTERDGKLYGLGSADMKGFLALAVELAQGLDPDSLAQPLMIVATADEESTMQGARSLAAAGRPLGRHVVVGEPTGLRPLRAHKGAMFESLVVLGRSGHSSDPSLGNSALEGMHKVIGGLLSLREELAAHRHEGFHVPVPTLNLGAIHGGDNPNRICGRCELSFDLRPLPGMAIDELRARVVASAEKALAGSGLTLEHRAMFPGSPPFEAPLDARIVRAAEELTEHAAATAGFATEAPYFAELGAEAVILGPGDIAVAHQPDEYLPVAHLEPTVQTLRRLVQRFCVEVEPS